MTDHLLAYHNNPELKAFLLRELRRHREADRLIKGVYWRRGKGCAVGCTLEAVRRFNGGAVNHSNHALYETLLGIPQMVAQIEDCIFEGLPDRQAREWPERFGSAIAPGADLSRVGWQFLHWLVTDAKVNPGIEHPIVRDAVRQCADILEPLAQGKRADRAAALSAVHAAERAVHAAERADAADAADAARSAADAADAAWNAEHAADAAWSAASAAASAAWSAASAAASAAWSAAARAAKSAAYVRMADKLVDLLEAA
jgi:hypothetical protein